MILALLLSSLLGPVASLAKGAQVFCADEAGNQKKPRLTVKAGGGNTLFLCAVSAKKRKGRLEVSGFKVFSVNRAGVKRGKVLFQSELGSRKFTAAASGAKMVLSELISDGKARVPAFENVLSCDKTGCAATPPACAFKKPVADQKALGAIEEYRHGEKQGKVPPPRLIDRLATLAYSGSNEALAVFRDRGGMGLDGETSARYYEHQDTIERLRKSGCL